MTSLSCRVLVAVGDEKIRASIESLVKALPIHAFYAGTSAEIQTYLSSSEGTDLVIIDDSLSDISTDGVCRAARARAPKIDSYIAVLTARDNPADALRAFASGADEVLAKPLDMIQFLNACRRAQRFTAIERKQAAAPEDGEEEEKEAARKAAAKKEQEAKAKVETDAKAEAKAAPPTPAAEEGGKPLSHGAVLTEDGRPLLVRQIEGALVDAFVEMGVAPEDCLSKPSASTLLYGDFIGWQGVFLPKTSQWYDILFHFTHTGAEQLCHQLLRKTAHSEGDLLLAILELLGAVHRLHRDRHDGGESGSAVFCQPLATPRFSWISEVGSPQFSQLLNVPKLTLVIDFFVSPGGTRIKPVSGIESGDVMNESIAASGQSRIPLVSRGVVLTPDRLRKIAPQVEASRNFWVIEPSLLARRLSNSIVPAHAEG